jgi:hypothetical protein
MTDYSRAKEIFFTYSSSKFQMMRDGFSGEYYSYEVSPELEEQWLNELITQELDKLDINNPDSLFPLWYILETNCNSRCFNDIIKFIENHTKEALNELNFLKFTAKVLNAIDRLQSSCSKINSPELNGYRRKIRALRKESE